MTITPALSHMSGAQITISATEVELSCQNSSALQHHKTSSAPRVLDQVKLLQKLLQGQPENHPIPQFNTIYIPEYIQQISNSFKAREKI